MKNREGVKNRKGHILMLGGLLTIVAALILTGYNYCEDRSAGLSSKKVLSIINKELGDIDLDPSDDDDKNKNKPTPDYVRNPDMPMPTIEIDGHNYIGKLIIPEIELELPVMDDWSYPNLKVSPCRYKGSVYKNDLIIAAHNYSSHFGFLKDLKRGDDVIFIDMNKNIFRFSVERIDTLAKYAVSELESGEWDLTLFTCTLGGETRVTVRCNVLEEKETDK